MRTTSPPSPDFDPERVASPEHHGAVAWGQFNESFEAFLTRDWRRVNDGTSHAWWMRALRLAMAYGQARGQTIADMAGKAAFFARLPIPRDPSIVFFGAEVGWEAYLLRALFGDGGRLWLIDDDPAAHARYEHAPLERHTRGMRVHRDAARTNYVRRDFFTVEPPPERFDVGLDWGLLEHFDDARKLEVVRCFERFLTPEGLQISSTPRDTFIVRLFYRAFAGELNFGYRELMSLAELRAHLRRAGRDIVRAGTLSAHNIVVSRARR